MTCELPDGQPNVTAYLTVTPGRDAIALYERAFGAEVLMQVPSDDGTGRIMHATLRVFGGMVMLSDDFPEFGGDVKSPSALGGTAVTMHVGFNTPAEVDSAFDRAAEAGCTVTMPAEDAFWGMRYGRLLDPFGHSWAFGAPLPAANQG